MEPVVSHYFCPLLFLYILIRKATISERKVVKSPPAGYFLKILDF